MNQILDPVSNSIALDMRGARIFNCPSIAGGGVGTLTQVLTAGDDAGGLNIVNVGDISFGNDPSPIMFHQLLPNSLYLNRAGAAFNLDIGDGVTSGTIGLAYDPAGNEVYVYQPNAIDYWNILWDGAKWVMSVSGGDTLAIQNVIDPVSPQDVATKNYVDTLPPTASNLAAVLATGNDGGDLSIVHVNGVKSNQTFSGEIDLAHGTLKDGTGTIVINWSGYQLRNSSGLMVDWSQSAKVDFTSKTLSSVADPSNPQDAATKNYSDGHLLGTSATPFALADATGGTPAASLVDVGAVPTQAAINDNFASIRAALATLGVIV